MRPFDALNELHLKLVLSSIQSSCKNMYKLNIHLEIRLYFFNHLNSYAILLSISIFARICVFKFHSIPISALIHMAYTILCEFFSIFLFSISAEISIFFLSLSVYALNLKLILELSILHLLSLHSS